MTLELLDEKILGNTLFQWVAASATLVTTVVILRLFQRLAGRRMNKLAVNTEMYWDDILAAFIVETKLLFLVVFGLFVGSLLLALPERVHSLVSSLLTIALLIQSGIWCVSILVTFLESQRQRALKKNPAAVTTINVIGLAGKFLLWSTVILLMLDNLGVNITAMVAGLGVGGVAIALAVQNILGDLFASLSIVLDKPFVVGDFIMLGEYMGSVEHIGLKTTRVHSLSGEQLVFSNSDLLNSRIRNFGRMFERRVVFSIGVTYQTSREKLKRIPEITRTVIESQEHTRFDRSHFMKYGDYSLNFETVYYVLSSDYNTYMDIQQSIYFAIHEYFEQEQIAFAYPTQTVLVSQPSENLS